MLPQHIELKQFVYGTLPKTKRSAKAFTRVFRFLTPSGQFWEFLIRTITNDILNDRITPIGEQYTDNVTSSGEEVHQDVIVNPNLVLTDSLWGNLLSCFASAVHRFQDELYNLYYESIPATADQTLDEWFKELGVPEWIQTDYPWLTEDEKRMYLHHKAYLDHEFGMSAQWLVKYAEFLGYGITFTEFFDTNNLHHVRCNINTGNSGTFNVLRLKADLDLYKPAHVYLSYQNNLT